MTNEGDWVFDPFLGTGTSVIAALRHKRKGAGAETENKYVDIALDRIRKELNGTLRTRPMNKLKYDPKASNNKLTVPPWSTNEEKSRQPRLLESPGEYHYENS